MHLFTKENSNSIRVSRRKSTRVTTVLMGLVALCTLPLPVTAQIQFSNATPVALDGTLAESWGGAWGDWNGDFWPDLMIPNHRERPSLYRNNGDGTFTNVILSADVNRGFLSDRDADHHGIALADFDGDGDDDMFAVTNGCCNSQFMTSEGETLVEEHAARGFPKVSGNSTQWMDWNKDGRLDLLVSASAIWEQDASGNFSNTGYISGCGGSFWMHLSDVNGDGVQDLLCSKEGTFPKAVWDISGASPVDITSTFPTVGNVVDSVTADFDNDLDPDFLFVRGTTIANQAALVTPTKIEANLDTASNQVANHPNNEDAGFTFEGGGPITVTINKATWFPGVELYVGASGTGLPVVAELTVTLDPNDSANHGIQTPSGSRDLYIGYDAANDRWQFIQGGASAPWWLVYVQIESTSQMSNIALQGERDVDKPLRPIYLRSEPGGYVNRTFESGLAQDIYQCNSVVAEDFDNDMDVDLFFACAEGVKNIANRVFENIGGGSFVEVANGGVAGVTGAAITDMAGAGEIALSADYDIDGFMDVFVTNGVNTQPVRVGGPHEIFRNVGNSNHWVEVELVGTTSNPAGIGATVYASAGGVTQMREYNGGYHRWSQNFRRAHFGLAGNTSVDIEVHWPNGTVENFNNLNADSLYLITEGGSAQAVSPGAVAGFAPPQPGDECGEPAYVAALDKAVFAYRDCATGVWSIRATGGTQSGVIQYTGTMTTDLMYSNVVGYSLEGSDSVTATADTINFDLRMISGGADGFDFDVSTGGTNCLTVNVPGDVPVYIGSKHVPASAPIDLTTMASCSTPAQPELNVVPLTVDENVGTADIEVTLLPAASSTVTVVFATQAGTATGGSDFYGKSETLTFNPGETSKTVQVTIVDNAVVEPTESFNARIFNATGAPIGTGTAPVTINDNDAGVPSLEIQPLTVTEGVGSASIEVTLTPAAAGTVTVTFSTVAGTATGGSDFYGKSESLTFNPGETSKTVDVTILDDAVGESTESFTGRIFNSSGAQISATTATITIEDDD